MATPHRLECCRCAKSLPAGTVVGLCECGGPILVRYEWAESLAPRDVAPRGRLSGTARFSPVLPLESPDELVTLGEGDTPLLPAPRLGRLLGASDLWIKDESVNPTGSFKARGMALAISMARKLGKTRVVAPSAGNAGAALAAYAARAGLAARIVLPARVPRALVELCRACGATVEFVAGSIADAGRRARHWVEEGWFDVSTLREPYRVEGKKLMGYELAEWFGFEVPDVILYPTGGGTGLVGMAKAFDEMESLGWIGAARPRFFAVQPESCAPIVRAFESGAQSATPWTEPISTRALGLAVPSAVGDSLMLSALRATGGAAIAVTEDEIARGAERLAAAEGIFASPESGAAVAGLVRLVESRRIRQDERVVLFVTGGGLSYVE